MTNAVPSKPVLRVVRRDPTLHLFDVGQTVRLKNPFTASTQSIVYKVTRKLPARNDLPQYRICNEAEGHERVATQDALELVATLGRSGSLLDRTFGIGSR